MGKIIVEVLNDTVVVTEYATQGFVVPDKISQRADEVPVKFKSVEAFEKKVQALGPEILAYTRDEFLMMLLSKNGSNVVRFKTYCADLYSERDMQRGITWGEVAYLLYYVGGLQKCDWEEIVPNRDLRIGILYEDYQSDRRINECLGQYKNGILFDEYVTRMRYGSRPIPLVLYCSYINLMRDSIAGSCGLTEEEIFKKVSVAEMATLLEDLKYE